MLDDFGSIERLAAETQLNERQIRLAIAYRDSYPEEITEAVAQNRCAAAEWQEAYPFIESSRLTPAAKHGPGRPGSATPCAGRPSR